MQSRDSANSTVSNTFLLPKHTNVLSINNVKVLNHFHVKQCALLFSLTLQPAR